MQFLVLILAVLPIYAAGDPLGEDHRYTSLGHLREKRQQQNYAPLNHGPPHIQQLLQAQNARTPLVNIPHQQVPRLGSGQPIKPQYVNQAQVSQYRPQVSQGNAGQQPIYKKPIIPLQRAPQPANYPQQSLRPNYKVPQQPQYSSNLPPHVQKLLQVQKGLSQ